MKMLGQLDTDQRQLLGGIVFMVLGFIFLVWLQSTNTPAMLMPVEKHEVKKSYELPKFYDKYSNHVYNSKFK